jgi:hypothetical protein
MNSKYEITRAIDLVNKLTSLASIPEQQKACELESQAKVLRKTIASHPRCKRAVKTSSWRFCSMRS